MIVVGEPVSRKASTETPSTCTLAVRVGPSCESWVLFVGESPCIVTATQSSVPSSSHSCLWVSQVCCPLPCCSTCSPVEFPICLVDFALASHRLLLNQFTVLWTVSGYVAKGSTSVALDVTLSHESVDYAQDLREKRHR